MKDFAIEIFGIYSDKKCLRNDQLLCCIYAILLNNLSRGSIVVCLFP